MPPYVAREDETRPIKVHVHTIIPRRSVGLSLATELKQNAGAVHVVIDFTGFKVYGDSERQREKYGERGRRTWRKLQWAIYHDTNEIQASE